MAPCDQLHQLIYSSVACPRLKLGEITSFLEVARKRNKDNDISGALVFANGFFLQILEGKREAISKTFGRIQKDNRHHDICLIDFRLSQSRRFDGWAMRHLGFSSDWAEGDFDLISWSAERCIQFFDKYQHKIMS